MGTKRRNKNREKTQMAQENKERYPFSPPHQYHICHTASPLQLVSL